MPFIGLADVGSKVAGLYHQELNWLKMGRMPAALVIDRQGRVRFLQYGESMADIPENGELFAVLDQINTEEPSIELESAHGYS